MQKINEAIFKQALGQFASGVTVITASNGNEDCGMTASAFCSLSLDPPRVGVREESQYHVEYAPDSSGYGVTILGKTSKSGPTGLPAGLLTRLGTGFRGLKMVEVRGIDCARAEMMAHGFCLTPSLS